MGPRTPVYFHTRRLFPMSTPHNTLKRASLPPSSALPAPQRDHLGFKIRRQEIDKHRLTAYDQLGGEASPDAKNLTQHKTILEEEAEGASYVIDGRLRRVNPYYFTYLTYCKLRWRGRKLIDVFVDEFRDRDAAFYAKTIAAGQVTLNKKPANLETVVKNGDLISHRCHRHEPPVSAREIRIVHEDDSIIAIDKPSGIPVHPAGRYRYNSVTKIFQHEYGKIVHPCNRLDRLTSGLMFLGKLAKGADAFVQQIKDRTVQKEYLARVKGCFPLSDDNASGVVVEKPLRTVLPKHTLNRVDMDAGKEAKTVFHRVSYDPLSNTSIVKCRPFTGRSHQIRVHLQYLGHPIANDPIYANEYVWGAELGAGDGPVDSQTLARLDEMGKTRPVSTWFHPLEDGEVVTDTTCEVCDSNMYTDPGPNDLDLWLHAYRYRAADKSWLYKTEYPEWALEPHRKYMEMALEQARLCGETQTQFNVGLVLVHEGKVLATGRSRELPGNTHAEQCALEKYYKEVGKREVPLGTEIYTTMEPCTLRLSGNEPCVSRILGTNIRTCFVGVVEPDTFVKDNSSVTLLEDGGVEYVHIGGYEAEALRVATLGHEKGVGRAMGVAREEAEKESDKTQDEEERNGQAVNDGEVSEGK